MLDQVLFTRSSLLGALVHFIVEQSPYLPDDLSGIVRAFDRYIDAHPFAKSTELGDMVMMECTEQELHSFVYEAVHTIAEIKVLNLSRSEIKRGLTVKDVDDTQKRGHGYYFVSRYDYIKKEHDFVSLGALARNVSNFLRWDHEKTQSIGKDIDMSPDSPANE